MKKKKMFKVRLIVLLLFVNALSASAQQDIQFSQYVFNPLALNTAYAGYRGMSYVNAMYRSQWVGLPGSPKTISASIEWLMPKTNDRVAWSARFTSDELGPQKMLSAFAGYTYRIPLDNDDTRRLCFGIGGGVNQYTLDGTAFQYVDNNDQLIPTNHINKLVPDANFGVYYYTPVYYLSLGASNLLSGNVLGNTYRWQGHDFEGTMQALHMYLGSGVVVPINEELKLKPSFLWKEDFKGPTNVDLNAFLLIHDFLWVGASYRTAFNIWNKNALQSGLQKTDAASFIVELFPMANFRIGYAYDLTTSKLNPYQNGTHEFSIGFGLPRKDNRELSPRYF